MASIEEVRAGIELANQKSTESLGALQQAQSQVEEAQAALQRVTEGSSQADVDDANAQLAQAVSSINEVQQMVKQAMSTAEAIAARL